MANDTQTNKKISMIKEFQCSGCVSGFDPNTCERFNLKEVYGFNCSNHVLGTTINLGLTFALGLPKGFNRSTIDFSNNPPIRTHSLIEIRLWEEGTNPDWDKFNIAVWAMERGGYLFVKTIMPRTMRIFTDVIENGTLNLVPNAYDVGMFYNDID